MKFLEFKLPKEIGNLFNTDYFISYILTDDSGFRIAFYNGSSDTYDIVFNFGHSVVDYRVSKEGRRFDHHVSNLLEKWLFTEIKDSDYLKKLDKEASGMLLLMNPDLRHYIAGDVDFLVDIISCDEPKVYKVKSKK